jgi:hypothetical protein
MSRRLVLAWACLLLAGCASMRSALDEPQLVPRTSEPPPEPVALAELSAPDARPVETPATPEAVAANALPMPGLAEPPAEAETAARAPELAPAPVDPEVGTTAYSPDANAEPVAAGADPNDDPGEPATQIAAQVGETIITLRELKRAVFQQLPAESEWNKLDRDQKNELGRAALEHLIDRALVIQDARRTLTKPKQWDMFKEFVEKMWKEDELPSLLKRHKVANEVELRKVLSRRKETLEEVHDSYVLDQMFRAYLGEKLRKKLAQPGFNEIQAYYRANLVRFQQPAQVTWRELFIPIDGQTPREAAVAQAEAARRRILQGEDFAKVVREVSQSAKASDGGLWVTSPGSFASDVVNQALDTLPPGRLSAVLEDPRRGCFVVRVESRRAAGPRPFEDGQLQTEIADSLLQAQYERLMAEYLADLRRQIPVHSPLLDGPEAPRGEARGSSPLSARIR